MYDWSTLASVDGATGECSLSDPDCRLRWELATVFMPRQTLKARLTYIKNLFKLDRRDLACALTLELLDQHADSAHVLNNVGVCALRRGDVAQARELFERAVHAPGYEAWSAMTLTNLQSLDKWMSEFRAVNGAQREPSAVETGTVVTSVLW